MVLHHVPVGVSSTGGGQLLTTTFSSIVKVHLGHVCMWADVNNRKERTQPARFFQKIVQPYCIKCRRRRPPPAARAPALGAASATSLSAESKSEHRMAPLQAQPTANGPHELLAPLQGRGGASWAALTDAVAVFLFSRSVAAALLRPVGRIVFCTMM